MKRALLALLAWPLLVFGQTYGPNEITIQKGSGTKDPMVIRRTANQGSYPILTVNKDDKVTVLQSVQMHSGLHVDTSTLPTFAKGTSELRVKPTAEPPSLSTEGAFRTTCEVTRFSFDDSLVYPGQPGRAHGHFFCANAESNAFSTAKSIADCKTSTARGGVANCSSYWFPALLDMRSNKPVIPTSVIVYYKNGSFSTDHGYGWAGTDGVWHEVIVTDPKTGRPMRKFPGFTDLPIGLAMIAGNPTRTTPRANAEAFDYRWTCQGPKQTFTSSIPTDCPVGSYVEAESFYPQCWDGKNLDSPDHKSHMSYSVSVRNEGDPRGWSHAECPPTHPVVLPSITINTNYNVVEVDAPKNWRLVCDMNLSGPAGTCLHSDWRNGWKPEISSAWTEHCIRAMKDCHAHLLGDGRMLY